MKLEEAKEMIMMGRFILEDIFGVRYYEVYAHREELLQQILADERGWGYNG